MAMSSRLAVAGLVVAAFAAGVGLHDSIATSTTAHAMQSPVFEFRTYYAEPGKLEALKARFRDHTIRIFNKHEMKSIGYWVPTDSPASENTLMYILQHPSREAAKEHWAAFQADPEWQKAKAESEKDGRLVTKVDSVFTTATDFSPIK
jgi:NIPSNAP